MFLESEYRQYSHTRTSRRKFTLEAWTIRAFRVDGHLAVTRILISIEWFRLFCLTNYSMKSRFYIIMTLVLLTSSCANKSVLTSYSPIKGYKYALIDDSKDRGGDASLMNFRIQLQQAIQETYLEEVKDVDVEKMTEEQKRKLMILQLSGSQTDNNSVATINILDYTTEKVLGSCNGIFGLSFSSYGDMNGAIKKSVRAFKRAIK